MTFTYINLFAGAGGARQAFDAAGGQCVFASDWDKHARQTYEANFGMMPAGDITKIDPASIPDHDVLSAGFPCQPFSTAGNKLGFMDKVKGTLFFNVAAIIKAKQPKAVFLENVKHLLKHDKGNTMKVVLQTLQGLGYHVTYRIHDAAGAVPQHRERIYIVAFKDSRDLSDFKWPIFPNKGAKLRDILEIDVPAKYTLRDATWAALQDHAARHKAKGNGFGYTIADPDGITRTLMQRYYKDGSEILIAQEGQNPRRLTPREAARLMGYPDSFKIVVSDTQAYRQFGNSVVVPVVEAIASQIAACIAS